MSFTKNKLYVVGNYVLVEKIGRDIVIEFGSNTSFYESTTNGYHLKNQVTDENVYIATANIGDWVNDSGAAYNETTFLAFVRAHFGISTSSGGGTTPGTGMSDSEVKAAYERNDDTNVFTDQEKDQLPINTTGIEHNLALINTNIQGITDNTQVISELVLENKLNDSFEYTHINTIFVAGKYTVYSGLPYSMTDGILEVIQLTGAAGLKLQYLTDKSTGKIYQRLQEGTGWGTWSETPQSKRVTDHTLDVTKHLGTDQNAALDGANSPNASNVFATMNDITSPAPPTNNPTHDGQFLSSLVDGTRSWKMPAFIDLSDTPDSLVGEQGAVPTVDETGHGLILQRPKRYTLEAGFTWEREAHRQLGYGEITTNDPTNMPSTTELMISHDDTLGKEMDYMLGMLRKGDKIAVNIPDESAEFKFELTDGATKTSDHWQVPVKVDSITGHPVQGRTTNIEVIPMYNNNVKVIVQALTGSGGKPTKSDCVTAFESIRYHDYGHDLEFYISSGVYMWHIFYSSFGDTSSSGTAYAFFYERMEVAS